MAARESEGARKGRGSKKEQGEPEKTFADSCPKPGDK